jgi:hypothetical protein
LGARAHRLKDHHVCGVVRRTGSSDAIKTFLLNFSHFVEVKSCGFLARASDRAQKVIANVQLTRDYLIFINNY